MLFHFKNICIFSMMFVEAMMSFMDRERLKPSFLTDINNGMWIDR